MKESLNFGDSRREPSSSGKMGRANSHPLIHDSQCANRLASTSPLIPCDCGLHTLTEYKRIRERRADIDALTFDPALHTFDPALHTFDPALHTLGIVTFPNRLPPCSKCGDDLTLDHDCEAVKEDVNLVTVNFPNRCAHCNAYIAPSDNRERCWNCYHIRQAPSKGAEVSRSLFASPHACPLCGGEVELRSVKTHEGNIYATFYCGQCAGVGK